MSWITVSRRGERSAVESRRLLTVRPGGAIAELARLYARGPVGPRALELEALLHLPRLANAGGVVGADEADAEVERLSFRLAALYEPVRELARPPAVAPALPGLHVQTVDELLAEAVMRHFHYLHSPRRESLHIGSYTSEGRLAALASLSPLDLETVARALPRGILAAEALVLSRVFAFDWAPRNTISHLLGQLERHLRAERSEVRFLLTYLNPNLGFDGASYRAANWTIFAHEAGTRYAYVEDDYVTDREIARLAAADRSRVRYSAMRLASLTIFGRFLHRRERRHGIPTRLLRRP